MTPKTGREKLDETMNKIRGEKIMKEEIDARIEKEEKARIAKDTNELAKKESTNSLDVVAGNPELNKMYQDNASLGSENLAGSSPWLKVHATGKSSTNELANGDAPNDGWFFYKPTGEQFETIECHILSISRGFRSPGMSNKGKKAELVFNQIMAGVIINDGAVKPFLMYLSGKKLSKMWEFGKEASKYTKAKPVPVPLFALKVKLTTEQEKSGYGPQWVINFEIVKHESGIPDVVVDIGKFNFLKDMVGSVKETVESLIATKTKPETPSEETMEDITMSTGQFKEEMQG